MTLKAIDEKLIRALGTNARISSEKLAKQLRVSPMTVRRRLKVMMRNGTIKTVPLIDPNKAGINLQTVIAISVERESLETAEQFLEKQSEVNWVAATTGRYDIMIMASFHSVDELSEFLQKKLASFKGIKNVETFVCLEVNKGSLIPME